MKINKNNKIKEEWRIINKEDLTIKIHIIIIGKIIEIYNNNKIIEIEIIFKINNSIEINNNINNNKIIRRLLFTYKVRFAVMLA